MCWSQLVSSRGQHLVKTEQPFYRGTKRKCCIMLQKQLLYRRISVKTMKEAETRRPTTTNTGVHNLTIYS